MDSLPLSLPVVWEGSRQTDTRASSGLAWGVVAAPSCSLCDGFQILTLDSSVGGTGAPRVSAQTVAPGWDTGARPCSPEAAGTSGRSVQDGL